MMRIPRLAAAACGALGLGLLLLLGVSGAAARPGGTWLGLPPLAMTTAALAGGVALALAVPRARDALRSGLGWGLPAGLLLAGVPLAGVQAVSGPPLLALLAAGAAVVLARVGLRVPRVLFPPLVFLVFVCAGARSNVCVGPQGDEPHYLMVADSLLRDHDVALERDYAEGRYAAFHDAPLAPHFRVRGRGGEIYSLHALGLSLAILPAWALGGYPAVTVFMALLAALLVCEARAWAAQATGRDDVAEAAAWVLALSPPLLHYAGLVFTEVPAALAFTYGLRRSRSLPLGSAGALAVGSAAAVLPWLNVRYAPLAALVVLHAAWREPRPRRLAVLGLPVVVSVLGIALYHHALYGFWNPGRVYGARPEFSAATLADGLPGLFLDQEFGLLVYAPVLVLALPGLVLLLRRDRRLGLTALCAVAAVVLTAGSWHMWRGGFNPPGRFLVPIVPLLIVCVALVWERRGLTAGTALLVGWGLWAGLGGALDPQLVHRDRDGTAPFFRFLAGAREWTGLLPRYVLEEPDRGRLALVWSVALLAAVPWRTRRVSASRAAVAALGLVAAAQLASLAGRREGADRDAVRLVGRPAIAVPGWSVVAAATGEWSPVGLDRGPLYEPHRYPGGLLLGEKLPLAPGPYRITLDAEPFAGGEAPCLEWARDRPAAVWNRLPMGVAPGGFAGAFTAPGGSVSVRLRDGSALLLRRVRLSSQPSAHGPV